MILADTSVWIDYFNGNDNKYTDALDAYLENDTVAMGDLIFLEILQGFKSDKEYRQAKTTLQALGQYEMFNSQIALKSADNYRNLRKKGITIRRTTDVIIATFCIENKLPLLFSDRDFVPFVEHLKMKPVLKET
ncbi:MAG: PIN domain nuclease [Pseudomonadales bacterium]